MLRCTEMRVNYPGQGNDTLAVNRSNRTSDPEIISVTQLNREARRLLEKGLPNLWVSGEISNLARPASGHLYFSLKDPNAQIQCAMFRGSNRKLRFELEDGMQVVVQARVSIYEPRGSYQLIVEHMEEAGEGLLRRRFEELKRTLDAEGLFNETHKQPLPELPASIGVVTSPSGAAIRDILNILRRRYPLAQVIVYPTLVQGEQAEAQIVVAIETAIAREECDVLIVARGGGSLEDLWNFNSELVARAIYACPIPVVAGIGHEVDFTIADLVADQRAPTPSGAAELIVPDTDELQRILMNFDRRAALSLQRQWTSLERYVNQLSTRLLRLHPGAIVQQLQQRADDMTRQLNRAISLLIQQQRIELTALNGRLRHASPEGRISDAQTMLQRLDQQMNNLLNNKLERLRGRFAVLSSNLNTVSPLATLERGYAIASNTDNGKIIRDAAQTAEGQRIAIRLAKGEITATVNSKKLPRAK